MYYMCVGFSLTLKYGVVIKFAMSIKFLSFFSVRYNLLTLILNLN